MAYFPFYMDITDKIWVIVGGGTIALHKIKILIEFGATMTVIAPDVQEDIQWLQYQGEQNKQYKIELRQRDFEDSDLERADYVIAATDDNQLNSHIARLCRTQNILVNVVDVKEECGFIFPSIQKKENLVVAVSTGGNSPVLAAKIKKDLETTIPDYYGAFNELLGEYRDYIKQKIADSKARKRLYQELINLAEAKGRCLSEEELRDVIHRY